MSVGLLLASLQATLDFEQELATSVGVMVRLLRPSRTDAQPAHLADAAVWRAEGSRALASAAFEPHLGLFVDAQDRCVASRAGGLSRPANCRA